MNAYGKTSRYSHKNQPKLVWGQNRKAFSLKYAGFLL